MLQPTRRRTWALSGHTPIHKVWDRHDRLSVQAAVTLPPRRQRLGVYFRMYEHNIDRQDVVSFVGPLRRMIRRKVVLILGQGTLADCYGTISVRMCIFYSNLFYSFAASPAARSPRLRKKGSNAYDSLSGALSAAAAVGALSK